VPIRHQKGRVEDRNQRLPASIDFQAPDQTPTLRELRNISLNPPASPTVFIIKFLKSELATKFSPLIWVPNDLTATGGYMPVLSPT